MALRGYSKKNRAARRRRRSAKHGGFGLVRHSKRKMSSRYYEREHTGKEQLRRSLNVGVYMQRGSRPTNTGRVHGFWAHACVGGTRDVGKWPGAPRFKKCGPQEFGRTPTIALKKALVSFGRSREVK